MPELELSTVPYSDAGVIRGMSWNGDEYNFVATADANTVTITGDQTITGTKTFTSAVKLDTNNGIQAKVANGGNNYEYILSGLSHVVNVGATSGELRLYSDGRPQVYDYSQSTIAAEGVALMSDIPAAVSGTNDGTNWTSLTIGSDTYALGTGSSTVDWSDITGKPTFATVATSGDYDDLTNKPVIPAAQVNSDWNATSGISQILNKPNLAAVATSGSYNDLSNTPTIPAAVSGTNDGTNWTSLTIGSDTYNIPESITGVALLAGGTSSAPQEFTGYNRFDNNIYL